MLGGIRSRLSYANVVASMALFIALGGVSYAAVKLPRNSVGPAQIKKHAVTGSKVKNSSLTGSDIKNSSLRGGDVRNSSLTGSDVKDGSLTAKDFNGSVQGAPGPQGPQGPQGATGDTGAKGDPGSSAVRLFASVASDGTLGRNSGATAAGRYIAMAGFYVVTFDADLTDCVFIATVGTDDALIASGGMISTARLGKNTVRVATTSGAGSGLDRPFYLAVHC